MEGLVASAPLPTLFGASCSLIHPLPLLSPHSSFLTVLLESLSFRLPLFIPSFLFPLHSLAVQPLANFLTSE